MAISLVVAPALPGCGASLNDPPLVEGGRLQVELKRRLALPVEKQSRVPITAEFANVQAIYTAASSTERLLAIVFDSKAATVQVLGRPAGSLRGDTILRHRNAVVLYEHDRGTKSRAAGARAALEAAATD